MENQELRSFEVGQLVEARTFQTGYRGAWFRCQITEIDQKRVALKYFDYPDEKIRRMRVIHQRPPWKPREAKRETMLRPKFPPVFCESQVPDTNALSEVSLVRDGDWKIGDLVDWLCDGAYWSGKITGVLNNDKVQIQLHPRPAGEGLSYEVFCKDLRPSLEWSEESGWKVLVPQGSENCRPCARLIQPVIQGNKKQQNGVPVEETEQSPAPRTDVNDAESGAGKGSGSGSISSRYLKESGESSEKEKASSKRIRLSESASLNSTGSGSLESLMMDLEELVTKVKWIRRMLEAPDSQTAGWKFIEHRSNSTSK